jgi:HK97 family phage major capsid protein
MSNSPNLAASADPVVAAVQGIATSIDGKMTALEKRMAALEVDPAPLRAGGRDTVDEDPVPVSGWQTREGAPIMVLDREQRAATLFRVPQDHGADPLPPLGTLVRAMITGSRNDAEKRALSGGSDAAGGFTVPTPLLPDWIDRLRSASVTGRAGARMVGLLSDDTSMAKLLTDPVPGWTAEGAARSVSDPSFGRVRFLPKTLSVIVRMSIELVADSINADQIVESAITSAFALEMDRAALFGSGVGVEPLGLANVAGLSSTTFGGANGGVPVSYDFMLDGALTLATANVASPITAILAPRTVRTLEGLKDTTNQPLMKPPSLATVPFLATTSVPVAQTVGTSVNCSTVLMGDFTQLLIGMRMGLTFQVLRERYADTGEVGLLAVARMDVQPSRVESFTRIIGIRP